MIDEELIKRILLEKPRKRPYVRRHIKLVDIDKIFTIIGPRRAGKTYFLFQIADELQSKGTKAEQILYLNFEDERLSGIEKEDLQRIIDIFYASNPEVKGKKVYFMFDEIQNVPEWQKFIRRLYDKENCTLYITGSSARILSKEIATELRGRTWNYLVYPFSFKEFLSFKGIDEPEKCAYNENRHRAIKLFNQYLLAGGFPEVVGLEEDQRNTILRTTTRQSSSGT